MSEDSTSRLEEHRRRVARELTGKGRAEFDRIRSLHHRSPKMQRVASLMGYELQHGIAAVPDYDALKPAAEALVDRLLDESRRGLIGENVSFDHLHLLACEVCDLPPREARYVAAMIAWKLASLEVKVT